MDRRSEIDAIVALIYQIPDNYSIGLRQNPDTASFEWITGELFTEDNWAPFQPDTNIEDDGSGLCVSTNPDGEWLVSLCSEERPYLCEYPRDGFSPPTPEPTTPFPVSCPCMKGIINSFESPKAADFDFKLTCGVQIQCLPSAML